MLIPFDANVIASRYGKAVDDIKRRRVEWFEGFAQPAKDQQQQLAQRRQTVIKLTFAEHTRDVARACQQQASALEVATEVECRNIRLADDFPFVKQLVGGSLLTPLGHNLG